jgi:hypothetical protein
MREGKMKLSEGAVSRMKEHLGRIPDPRRQWRYLRHKLIDLLVIGLCSIITCGEGFEEMGRDREEWFWRFLDLPHGIPDEDTFHRLFERLDPGELMRCPQSWLGGMNVACRRQVSIDGKTIRGSGKTGEHKAVRVVSAWVGENNLVLGQLSTEEKSKGNEVSTNNGEPLVVRPDRRERGHDNDRRGGLKVRGVSEGEREENPCQKKPIMCLR